MKVFGAVRSLTWILWAGMLVGCFPPTIVSARDPDFGGRITHVMVLIRDDGTHDAELEGAALQATLNARRIAHRVYTLTDSEDPTDFAGADASFTPDATLRIEPILTVYRAGGIARDKVYVDASLYLPGETTHRVWRAKVVHLTGQNPVDPSGLPHWAGAFARRVVDQLVADGVLGPG